MSPSHHAGHDHAKVTDPVCGMQVDPATTPHHAEHAGVGYYFCSARCQAKFVAEHFGIPAISTLLGIPFYVAALLVDSAVTALILFAFPPILNTLWYGPGYAAVQGLVRPQTRATASAVLLFIINLIGLGLGPLGVGAVSDFLSGPMGLGSAEGVRWSLMIFIMFGALASALFWMARSSIREEMVS